MKVLSLRVSVASAFSNCRLHISTRIASQLRGNGTVCIFGGASVRASRLVSSLAPTKLYHYQLRQLFLGQFDCSRKNSCERAMALVNGLTAPGTFV